MSPRVCPLLVVFAVFLAAAGLASAQEAIPLAFKYAVGDVFQYEVTVSGSGGLRAPDGQFSPAGIQGNLRLSATVAEVLPNGNSRLQLTIPRASFQMNVAQERANFNLENGKIRWFANGREQSPPDADLSQAPLISVPLQFVASPNGRIVDVTIPTIPDMDKVSDMMKMFPGMGPGGMQNMSEPLLPDTPVKVGDTWRKTTQLTPFGAEMPITITVSHTLDSVSTEGGIRMARISGYSETRFRASELPLPMGLIPGDGSGVSIGIPDMRQTVTSTEFFDVDAGRLFRGDYDLSFMTRVSVSMQGQKSQEASVEARAHAMVQAR